MRGGVGTGRGRGRTSVRYADASGSAEPFRRGGVARHVGQNGVVQRRQRPTIRLTDRNEENLVIERVPSNSVHYLLS